MIIALADLLEAEGRSLRRALLRTGLGLAVLAAAAVLALGGVLLCVWAGYQLLLTLWGPVAAALVIGVFMISTASICIWIVIRLNR